MAVVINPQDGVLFKGANPVLFPVDANDRPSAFLSGLDLSDNVVLASFTADRRLRVDASVTIDNVDIGDVNMKLKVGGIDRYWGGVLNPDSTTYSGYVQDPRMVFSAQNELKTLSRLSNAAGTVIDPATEQTSLGILNALGGPLGTAISTTIARDANNLVSSITETDGISTKVSTVFRDANSFVTSVVEAFV